MILVSHWVATGATRRPGKELPPMCQPWISTTPRAPKTAGSRNSRAATRRCCSSGAAAIVFPAASEATRDGWSSSFTGSFPSGWRSLQSVACASASLCYAGGTDLSGNGEGILATTNFGKTWKTVPDGGLMTWAVSCADGATCVAGGADPNWAQFVVKTADGGGSWTKTTISTFPSADGMFTISLACPSADHCVAIEIGSGPTVITVS